MKKEGEEISHWWVDSDKNVNGTRIIGLLFLFAELSVFCVSIYGSAEWIFRALSPHLWRFETDYKKIAMQTFLTASSKNFNFCLKFRPFQTIVNWLLRELRVWPFVLFNYMLWKGFLCRKNEVTDYAQKEENICYYTWLPDFHGVCILFP